jgi:hypothetical protein
VISSKWVVRFLAFSAYPAGNSRVSDLFGSLLVVAFVVRSVWFGVLLMPDGLASSAACGVGCEGATVEAGSSDRHWLVVLSIRIRIVDIGLMCGCFGCRCRCQ